MKNNDNLEIYYSRDTSWNNLVETFKKEFWRETEYQLTLLKELNNNLDIAIVIYGRVGLDSLQWIHRKVPALDSLLPIECLYASDLLKRLKECLMRMP